MSDSTPSYTCGTCGRAFAARPIHCECGARFDRDGLTSTQARGGGIAIDVLRVGADHGAPVVGTWAREVLHGEENWVVETPAGTVVRVSPRTKVGDWLWLVLAAHGRTLGFDYAETPERARRDAERCAALFELELAARLPRE